MPGDLKFHSGMPWYGSFFIQCLGHLCPLCSFSLEICFLLFWEILFFCDHSCPPLHFCFCFFFLELKLLRYWLFWIDNFILPFLSSFPCLIVFWEISSNLSSNSSTEFFHDYYPWKFHFISFLSFLPSFFYKRKFFCVSWKLKLLMIKKNFFSSPVTVSVLFFSFFYFLCLFWSLCWKHSSIV